MSILNKRDMYSDRELRYTRTGVVNVHACSGEDSALQCIHLAYEMVIAAMIDKILAKSTES